MSNHQERVSPWDIDFSGNYAPLSIQSSPRLKKLRSNPQLTPPISGAYLFISFDFLILHRFLNSSEVSFSLLDAGGGGAVLDFEESVRSSKVLQGQENVVGLVSPFYRTDRVNRQLDFKPVPNRMEKTSHNYGEFMRNHAPSNFTGFLESNWFPKVLQGQEICSFKSLAGRGSSNSDLGLWSKPQLHQRPMTPSFYPLASEGSRSIHTAGQIPLMLSNFPNFQTGNHVLSPTSILSGTKADVGRMSHLTNEPSAPATSLMHVNSDKEKVPNCKIFGFSLTEDPSTVNLQGPSKRSCTKVSFEKV